MACIDTRKSAAVQIGAESRSRRSRILQAFYPVGPDDAFKSMSLDRCLGERDTFMLDGEDVHALTG